jgi:branched-chain amino acid transport system ATP-binding protein
MTKGLIVRGLHVTHGSTTAVHNVDLEVAPGTIVGLVGANGAGKSSTARGLSGLARATATELSVGGVDLRDLRPELRASHLAHVPEGRHLFSDHTVRENLLLGAFGVAAKHRRERLDGVLSVLPQLADHLSRPAGALSGGQQQMVAIGRGLMNSAPILIVDELSLGLAPLVVEALGAGLVELKRQGLGVLLVEQYLSLVLDVSDEVLVMQHGAIVLRGTAEAISADAASIRSAYLGLREQD